MTLWSLIITLNLVGIRTSLIIGFIGWLNFNIVQFEIF